MAIILSIIMKPKGEMDIIFEGKLEDENIHFIFVKHWISDLPSVLMFFLLYILPLFLLIAGSFSFPTPMMFYTIWIGACLYFTFFGLFMLIHWFNDYFDFFVLTDKRLIDITQLRFLVRKTTVAELSTIQHATFKQRGLLDTILGIGHVEVLTAGTNPDLVMEEIEDPAEVTDQILKCSRDYKLKVHEEQVEEGEVVS